MMAKWSYEDGYAYCSVCRYILTPYEAYMYNMRCPICHRKVRGQQRQTLTVIEEKLRTMLSPK